MFFRVAIFLSRTAIAGGAMLVLMETLSDYGTAAYYGVETFGAGILSYGLTWATRTRPIHTSETFNNVRLYFDDI